MIGGMGFLEALAREAAVAGGGLSNEERALRWWAWPMGLALELFQV